MDEDDIDDAETLTLTDSSGRSLVCYVEQALELEGKEYVLLSPVDPVVEIFVWQQGEDEEEPLMVEDDLELDKLFPIASAVLQEQNLTLKRTAVALTVEGELPELTEEDLEEDVLEEDEESEALQLLTSFYHEEQEYAIYSPLDPFFILARMDEQGQPVLLTPEEYEQIEPMLPMLEDQLFDEME
ncbi:hypothetical protein BST81_21605 [Leptolyngbya sp. 'hensonii']|nr:hypothetical protein BST81_21605 [Leptolyngbya sp. 'hensonii']